MNKIIRAIIIVISSVTMIIGASATEMSVADVKENNNSAVTVDATVNTQCEIKTFGKAVVLMEKSTGKVLFGQNENEKLYPASVTKIMTMLLVCEAIDSGKITLADKVTCSDNAASKGGSQIWLEPGETMTVEDLLKATCIYSANDACTLLGEYVSGSENAFTSAMNEKAEQLGMKNTHFDNCTGLDDTTEDHLTTAYDIGVMSCELLKHELIKNYTTIWMDSLRGGETELVNTNRLVRFYDGVTGLKTGTTEKAGCCVSASAKRDGMELVAVVLGSDNSTDRFTSAENLLDWGFANYEIFVPDFDEALISNVKVFKGREDSVSAVIPDIASVLINKGKAKDVTVKVQMDEKVDAPVEKDMTLGKISVYLDEKLLAEYDVKAECSVPKLTFFTSLYKLLTSFSIQ